MDGKNLGAAVSRKGEPARDHISRKRTTHMTDSHTLLHKVAFYKEARAKLS